SQMFRPGYIAYHRDEFRAYFEQAYVQIPLAKGDMLFFNPALFHAAGENRTRSIDRMANLLLVSSPFGIPLESIDRPAMCRALYPALQGMSLGAAEQAAAIACAADGYSFSTNLDTDPPVGGLAPETMATLMARMLADGASPTAFHTALDAQCARRAATPGAPT
ncbi:MAG: phytanoyl-CoA dioxygenase family protein, partial [Paracoccaceae bacterium]